jgi:hypothetical protein
MIFSADATKSMAPPILLFFLNFPVGDISVFRNFHGAQNSSQYVGHESFQNAESKKRLLVCCYGLFSGVDDIRIFISFKREGTYA